MQQALDAAEARADTESTWWQTTLLVLPSLLLAIVAAALYLRKKMKGWSDRRQKKDDAKSTQEPSTSAAIVTAVPISSDQKRSKEDVQFIGDMLLPEMMTRPSVWVMRIKEVFHQVTVTRVKSDQKGSFFTWTISQVPADAKTDAKNHFQIRDVDTGRKFVRQAYVAMAWIPKADIT